MKLTDISNNKAKEIIKGAPKEATHFSCIEGKTQYYKNETVISPLDEVFINVFRDIFQPSVFLLSDLENKMNIDKVETQTPETMQPRAKYFGVKKEVHLRDYQKETQTEHQEEMSEFTVVAAKYTDVDGGIFEQVDFDKTILTIDGDICIESDLYFAWSNKNIVPVSDVTGRDLLMNRHKLCRRAETKQQREDRERLERKAIFVRDICSRVPTLKVSQAKSLYEAGYRMEIK